MEQQQSNRYEKLKNRLLNKPLIAIIVLILIMLTFIISLTNNTLDLTDKLWNKKNIENKKDSISESHNTATTILDKNEGQKNTQPKLPVSSQVDKKNTEIKIKKYSVLLSYHPEMSGGDIFIDNIWKSIAKERSTRIEIDVLDREQKFLLKKGNRSCLTSVKITHENQQIPFLNCK